MNLLSTTSNAIVTGNQWNPAVALTKPTPTTITEDRTSFFYDFTFRLTERQEKAIIEKWAELADRIDVLAIDLIEQLRNDPHTFYDQVASNQDMFDNLDAIALYAARPDDRNHENCLSTFELSNLLQFRSACTRWGRDQVKVHLLKTGNGQRNKKAVEIFLSTIKNLYPSPDWNNGHTPYDATTIPWHLRTHQLMFMTAPPPIDGTNAILEALGKVLNGFTYAVEDNEKRRFIVTQQLLDGFLDKIYPYNPSSSLPVIGNAHADDFKDFKMRPVAIPCSFAPHPDIADGYKVTCAEDYHVHDVYHIYIDKANPHLMAFQELLNNKIIEALPYAKETMNGKILPFYELYLDREYGGNLQYSHFAKDTQFWLCLMHTFQRYAGFLKAVFNDDKVKLEETLKEGMSLIVDYIGNNRARWQKDYGINLRSLRTLCYDNKCTKGNTVGINAPFYQDCITLMKNVSFKYFAEDFATSQTAPGTSYNVLDSNGKVIRRVTVQKDN